jgi:hypothetical protein
VIAGGKRSLICLAMCGVAHSAGAQLEMRTVSVYEGLVTLEIPADWNEIPPDVLEFYSIRSAEASGGVVAETYQHGFRQGDPEADFAPPQILIQIRESGRVNHRDLRRLPSVEDMRASAGELAEQSGPFLENLNPRQISYDPATYSLRISNTLDLSFEGLVIVDSASFLTQRGTFTVHCYALRQHYQKMAPVFAHVLSSVRIDESIRYRPRPADLLPRPAALAAYAIAATLAVAILLVHLVQRRRRQT